MGLRAEAVQLQWQWREEVPSFLVGEGVRHNGYFNRPSLLGVEGLIPERALPDFNDGILCKKAWMDYVLICRLQLPYSVYILLDNVYLSNKFSQHCDRLE